MKKTAIKLLLAAIGIAFIAYGTLSIMLGFVGVTTFGEITVIRREGGERNETHPNRYNYSVEYRFKADGKMIYGNTKRVGNAYSAGISKGKTTVKYLKAAPFINVLAAEAGLSIGNLVISGVGILLVFSSIYRVR